MSKKKIKVKDAHQLDTVATVKPVEMVEPNEIIKGDKTKLDRPIPYKTPLTSYIYANVHRLRDKNGKDVLEVLRTKAGVAGDEETRYLTLVICDALNKYAEGR